MPYGSVVIDDENALGHKARPVAYDANRAADQPSGELRITCPHEPLRILAYESLLRASAELANKLKLLRLVRFLQNKKGAAARPRPEIAL